MFIAYILYIKQVFSLREPSEDERKKFLFDVLLEKPLQPVVSPPILQTGWQYALSSVLGIKEFLYILVVCFVELC